MTEHSDLKQNPIWQGSDLGPVTMMVRQTLGSSCFNDLYLYSDSILQPANSSLLPRGLSRGLGLIGLCCVSQHKALVFNVRDVTRLTCRLYTDQELTRLAVDMVKPWLT